MQEIEVKDLYFVYSGKVSKNIVLQGINLRLEGGKLISLAGPSGSGKTTLLKLIQGKLSPSSGEINGVDFERVGYLDQFSYTLLHHPFPVKDLLKIFYPERDIGELLEFVNLTGREDTPSNSLSFGESQRLFLLIALHKDPEVLLIDEATAQLDQENTETILSILRRLSSDGKVIIVATHDPRVIEVADQVIRIEDGYVESTQKDMVDSKLHFYVKPHAGNAIKIPDLVLNAWDSPETIHLIFSGDQLILEPMERQVVEEINIEFTVREDKFKVLTTGVHIHTPAGVKLKIPPEMEFHSGEIVGLVGPSGSGKSTFLDWALHEVDPHLKVEGKVVLSSLDRDDIIYLRQREMFPEDLTVSALMNLLLTEEERGRAMQLFQYLGLPLRGERRIDQYSGGQRYMIAIGIAIARFPRVLVLDETLANIDRKRKELLLSLLRRMRDHSTLVIISTHEARVSSICDRIYKIDKNL